MVAVISAALTPISALSAEKSEPRKFFSLPVISPLKIPNFNTFSTTFHSGLALSSSFVIDSAKALTYEEALNLSTTSSDSNEIFDSVVNFAAENPLVLAGGAAILGLPLILSQVFQKPKPWGVESAKKAYAVLSEDNNAQLLDIRAPAELRKAGKPDVSGLKKKPVSVAYNREDKSGFLKKLSLKFKDSENTTLFILDKFDGDAELVAELVTVNGFKAAYAIKDGAEGPRGWLNSGLPWIQPSKGLSFDLSSFTGALGDGTDGLSLTVGIAAAAGLGVLAFSEIETMLQVLGSAAIIQFATKKLLFAEDRKQTLQQLDEFLNTKVAPKELVDEIKQIGKALLPETVTSKSLPAPEQSSTENSTVKPLSSEAAPADTTATEPTPKVNSVKSESVSRASRPLSPYPYYPDFKPPTSPTPSQP